MQKIRTRNNGACGASHRMGLHPAALFRAAADGPYGPSAAGAGEIHLIPNTVRKKQSE